MLEMKLKLACPYLLILNWKSLHIHMAVNGQRIQFIHTFMDRVMQRVGGEIDARFHGFFQFRHRMTAERNEYSMITTPNLAFYDNMSNMHFYGQYETATPDQYTFWFSFTGVSAVENSINRFLFEHVLKVTLDRTDAMGNKLGRIPNGNWVFFQHRVVLFPDGTFIVQFCPGLNPEVEKIVPAPTSRDVHGAGYPVYSDPGIVGDRHLNLIDDVLFPFFKTVLAVYHERMIDTVNPLRYNRPGPGAQSAGGLGKDEERIVSVLETLHSRLACLERERFRVIE